MKEFKFVIGDWSEDGHSRKDYVHFKSNKTGDEIREAYWLSCFRSGIAFHHSDLGNYDGYNKFSKDYANTNGNINAIKHRLLCDYEDNIISVHSMKHLHTFGLKDDIFENLPNENGDQPLANSEELSKLLLWFISESLEDFEYKLIDDQVECINGFWDKGLNVQFGYGLYYD